MTPLQINCIYCDCEIVRGILYPDGKPSGGICDECLETEHADDIEERIRDDQAIPIQG